MFFWKATAVFHKPLSSRSTSSRLYVAIHSFGFRWRLCCYYAGFPCHSPKFLAPDRSGHEVKQRAGANIKKSECPCASKQKHQFKHYPKLANLADNY